MNTVASDRFTLALTIGLLSSIAAPVMAQLNPPTIPGDGNTVQLPRATRSNTSGLSMDYYDLQAAIDDAGPGDTISLEAGTWDAGLKVSNKWMVLITGPSTGPRAIIHGNGVDQGMLLNQCDNVRIRNLDFRACVGMGTTHGGGLSIDGGRDIHVQLCNFDACVSESGGGILADRAENLAIESCVFTNNTAKLQFGGAANLWQCEAPTVSDSIFRANVAGARGGGLYAICPAAGITLTRCNFEHNRSDGGGGGFSLAHYGTDKATCLIDQCRFTGNRALGSSGSNASGGGGLSVTGLWDLSFTLTGFDRNRADHGAAMAAYQGTVAVMHTGGMHGNRATDGGDHVWLDATSSVRMRAILTECGDDLSSGVHGTWIDAQGNSLRAGCALTADIDFDGSVGIGDLLEMLSNWGPTLHNMADIARGQNELLPRVDAADIVRLLNAWGDGPSGNVDIIPEDGNPFRDF